MINDQDLRDAEISAEFTGEELLILTEVLFLMLLTKRVKPDREQRVRKLLSKIDSIIQYAKSAVHEE